MPITRTNVIALAPELASMPTTQVDEVITDVTNELANGVAFGDAADRAMKYLACHYLTMLRIQRTGAAGPVVSETKSALDEKGNPTTISVSYASPRQSKAEDKLRTTVYGQMYLDLAESSAVEVIPVLVV